MRWSSLSSLGVEGAGGVSMLDEVAVRCAECGWVRFWLRCFRIPSRSTGTQQKGGNESAAGRKSGLKIGLVFILSLGGRSARFVGVAVVEY